MRLFLTIFNQYEMSLHYAFIVLKALKIDRWRLSTQSKKKCHLLCYIYFCWFRNFKGKNRVWPFHRRIISSWSLKSRKFSASFLLLYSLIFSVKRPLAVLLVIKHSAVKAATHFQLYDEEDTTTSTTVFENYSKCRILNFLNFGIFHHFLSY